MKMSIWKYVGVLATLCFCAMPLCAQSKLVCKACHAAQNSLWLQGNHSHTQHDVADELAANWKGQAPDSVIFGSSAEDCVSCHGPTAITAGSGMTEVQVMGHFFTTTGGVYTDSTTVADTASWPHVNCVTCHNVPSTHPSDMPVSAAFNSATGGYDSVQTTSEVCGQCHGTLRHPDTDHQIYDAWRMSRHGSRGQQDVAGELAASWAGSPPDSVINGSSSENCIACHASSAVPQIGSTTEVDVLRRFFTTTAGVFTANTTVSDTVHFPDVACVSCHNPHNPGKLSYYNSSTKAYEDMPSADSLCGQCHGSLRFPDTDHRSYDIEQGKGAVGVADKITMPGVHCVDCHMSFSDIDGTNSTMYKGHTWSVFVEEPGQPTFASCTKCHGGMAADSAALVIAHWQSEYQSLDSAASSIVGKADSVARAKNDSTMMQSIAAAEHNLTMAETDESGGFHNHLYSVALLQDAIARASVVTGMRAQQQAGALPAQIALLQNFPNPFNPTTTIRYSLPRQMSFRLSLYNALGQRVAIIAEGEQEAGYHEVKFDGSRLASGMYVYRIEAGRIVQTRTLLLLK